MIQKNFGNVLRSLRQERGISQEKFALSINMDRTYYASVELGRRNISIRNIEKIANGLGINISDIFVEIKKGEESNE